MSAKKYQSLRLISLLLKLWDIISYPIYQIIYRPWNNRKRFNQTQIIDENKEEIVFQTKYPEFELQDLIDRAKCDSLDKAWNWTVKNYEDQVLLGSRDLIQMEKEIQPESGKVFQKVVMGDYKWMTYKQVNSVIRKVGCGLRQLIGDETGLEKVAIFADTRAEWFITAQACFREGIPLVTLYTNLGDSAVAHGINQSGVGLVITSHDLLPKFRNILALTPKVKTIVFFPHQLDDTDTDGFRHDVNMLPYKEIISRGAQDYRSVLPEVHSDHPAIIMYTSGSTGVPKGVILTHGSIAATLFSVAGSANVVPTEEDCYLAYLPLAHVLELISEMLMCVLGVKIGYSHPNTLLDSSTMIKKGQKGDASVLQPTIMGAVPLVLDRIYKAINSKIEAKGPFYTQLFRLFFDYKLAAIKNGESTPILDSLIFRKIKAAIGGRIRLMFSGGAPLSEETHEFVRVVFGTTVAQGYGLTETSGMSSVMEFSDTSTGSVGCPMKGIQMKLVNWEEGGYRVTDKTPRGEIHIGGDTVAAGYYNMSEKTAEDFYVDNGRRWFKTGDVGKLLDDGNIKIIDRKKDLVKLQFGEYVSLGKVESVLKTCPLVDNVCVYGDPTKTYTVALVTPCRPALAKLAVETGVIHNEKEVLDNERAFQRACDDKRLLYATLKNLSDHGRKARLEKFELPGAVTMCKELWGPDSGFVTAAFKLKRRPIQEYYQKDLNRMYESNRGV